MKPYDEWMEQETNYALDAIIDEWKAYRTSQLSPDEIAELAEAKREGRLVVLPLKLGTLIQQDIKHEYDMVFTGEAIYHIVSNDESGWFSLDEIQGLIRDANIELTRAEAEAALAAKKGDCLDD